jgi:hypothetical protein
VYCLTLLVAYPVYNLVGVLARQSHGISPAKTPRPQRSENNNKQFVRDNLFFPPKLGVLCALAGVKSPDRKFHVEQ